MTHEPIPTRRGRGSRLFRDEEWCVLVNRLGLSPREAEIVRLIFDDLSKDAIARQLSLSSHTIQTYLRRLYRKLDVRSRGELLILVFFEFLESQ